MYRAIAFACTFLLLLATARAADQSVGIGAHERAIEALIEAAKKGQIPSIKRLLASGVDVNAETEGGEMALYEAAASDQAATVDALLAAGADPNARGKFGNGHSLGVAIGRNKLGIARALIKAGADVNARDQSGEAALMLARNAEAAKLLLAEGASIDARDGIGRTALAFAVASSNAELVRELLDRGADINSADDSGDTALHEAAGEHGADAEAVVALLIARGASLTARNSHGETPLHQMMRDCSSGKVTQVLRAGGRFDLADDEDIDRFYQFSGCGDLAVLKIILAVPGVPDRKRLLEAAYFGAIEAPDFPALDMLFDLGVSPHALTQVHDIFGIVENATGLMFSVLKPRTKPELIHYLIKRGVPLEGRDSRGRTALILAATRQKLDIAQALLMASADPNAQATDGSTALMRAIDHTRGPEGDVSVQPRSVCKGLTDMINLLLRQRANIHLKGEDGKTALQWAQEARCTHTYGPGPAAVIGLLRNAEQKPG